MTRLPNAHGSVTETVNNLFVWQAPESVFTVAQGSIDILPRELISTLAIVGIPCVTACRFLFHAPVPFGSNEFATTKPAVARAVVLTYELPSSAHPLARVANARRRQRGSQVVGSSNLKAIRAKIVWLLKDCGRAELTWWFLK